MKKILFLIALALGSKGFSQPPLCKWASSYGLAGQGDAARAVTCDGNGTAYLTGSFVQSIILGTYTLTSHGYGDILVAKIDSSSNVIWAKNFGGAETDEEGLAISVDNDGNVFITGYFASPFMVVGNDTLHNADGLGNSYDIFIAKLDPSGTPLWARSSGGYFYEKSRSVTTDSAGNCYITGHFNSPYLAFDSDTIYSNGSAAFVTKFDSNGHTIWAKSFPGMGGSGAGILAEENGDVYLTGVFTAATFSIGSYTLVNADASGNYYDFFLAKFSSAGNVMWANNYGGHYNESTYGISRSKNSIVVTGSYNTDTLQIGADTLIKNNQGYAQTFTACFSSAGIPRWARGSQAGPFVNQALAIAGDEEGNSYVTGSFQSPSITFDTLTLINSDSSNYYFDVFIIKYDSLGRIMWGQDLGGSLGEEGWGISAYKNDNIYVTGYFWSPSMICGTHTLICSDTNYEDIFFVKLGKAGSTLVGDKNFPVRITVSPNPTANILRIDLPTISPDLAILSLSDPVTGRIILEKRIKAPRRKEEIDLASCPNGMYLLTIRSDMKGAPAIFKIIKTD